MPPKYPGRNNKAPPQPPKSSDESSVSPDKEDGDDIIQIFAAFHNRMEKKAKQKQSRLASECDATIQYINDLATELVKRHKFEFEYKRKHEELEQERLDIVKKLRLEEVKYLQNHDIILNELIKSETAQLKTYHAFERKYGSFIEGLTKL
ncbi:10056_t:CDS:2 [Ambispora gerdemannii]|uniref:10056_t:CDS:1 n=1 Tax=Ambispora gerdemannii TaxID=144530 RepID=A0A9N9F861_9GLOM|nr:10056_t:CDS:2 [Ambispora gerdemannii]